MEKNLGRPGCCLGMEGTDLRRPGCCLGRVGTDLGRPGGCLGMGATDLGRPGCGLGTEDRVISHDGTFGRGLCSMPRTVRDCIGCK